MFWHVSVRRWFCLSTPGGGTPVRSSWGVPWWEVTPPWVPPYRTWLGGTPMGGTPPWVPPIGPGWGYPDGGLPKVEYLPLGYPSARSDGGYPNQGGTPPRVPPIGPGILPIFLPFLHIYTQKNIKIIQFIIAKSQNCIFLKVRRNKISFTKILIFYFWSSLQPLYYIIIIILSNCFLNQHNTMSRMLNANVTFDRRIISTWVQNSARCTWPVLQSI